MSFRMRDIDVDFAKEYFEARENNVSAKDLQNAITQRASLIMGKISTLLNERRLANEEEIKKFNYYF